MNSAFGGNVSQFPKRKLQPFETFSPTAWQDLEPEPVQWLVQNCIPRETVCLFTGDSGLGKSLLMQQLQTCLAIGRPWLGNDVGRVRSFGFYCEDPKRILQARQRDICQGLDVDEGDLEDMLIASRVGMDNVLMDFNRRTDEGRLTPLYEQLRTSIRDFGAELVIIDTAAHTFNGNENIRSHVTSFVATLQEIATETGGAVILCAHPSVSSMASGSGYSGNTAWRATARAHMYLKRPKNYDDEDPEAEHNIRILKTMKANWGAGGGATKLKWEGGLFTPMEPDVVRVRGAVDRIEIDRTIYEAARWTFNQGDRISAGTTHQRSLVTLASRLPSCKSYRRNDIIASQQRLLENGKLVTVTVGPKSRRYNLIRPADLRYPDEGDAVE